MGTYYPGTTMAAMQQQVMGDTPQRRVIGFRVEFVDNGYLVISKTAADSNPQEHICADAQQVADRVLAAMVEFKMERNK